MSTQTTHGTGAQSPTSSVGAVGHETKDAASQVAGTATDEAKKVAREATDQARQLWQQARSDLTDQASSQQDRAAQGLRQLSDQLRTMADGAQDDGMARGLVDDVARRAGDVAGWLEQRDPGAIVEEARRFAQRRPGAFLAAAAGLGVVAGRLSRSVVDEKREEHSSETSSSSPGASATAATSATSGVAPAPTGFTTESTSVSPGAGPQTVQPVVPGESPSPVDDDGLMAGQDPDRGAR